MSVIQNNCSISVEVLVSHAT